MHLNTNFHQRSDIYTYEFPFYKVLYLSVDVAFSTECLKFRSAYARLPYTDEPRVTAIN